MERRVLITGVSGQDGGYMAERLVREGVEVHGLSRSGHSGTRSGDAPRGISLHEGDLTNRDYVESLISEVQPTEIYNLAGISSVAQSWNKPIETALVCGVSVSMLLEAALKLQEETGREVSFLQASSAEIFGAGDGSPFTERSSIAPLNPYGAAKAFAHLSVGIYRQRGLKASSCILFGHESPRRPASFVTRKITVAAAAIAKEGSGLISLGNIEATRDWGWAPDYVDAMLKAAQHRVADDYVVATGTAHSVADFAEAALRFAGLGDFWRDHIEINPAYFRLIDIPVQIGDSSKIRRELGWSPTLTFPELVERMVLHDMEIS